MKFLFFQYPELLLASYNSNEESPHDPDGVALLWNMKFKKTTPEYVFHCQVSLSSQVSMICTFSIRSLISIIKQLV